jgi:hypothetical protein
MFLFGSLKRRVHSEDLGIEGRIILKWTLRVGVEGEDWSYLAQDVDRWLAFVNTEDLFRSL